MTSLDCAFYVVFNLWTITNLFNVIPLKYRKSFFLLLSFLLTACILRPICIFTAQSFCRWVIYKNLNTFICSLSRCMHWKEEEALCYNDSATNADVAGTIVGRGTSCSVHFKDMNLQNVQFFKEQKTSKEYPGVIKSCESLIMLLSITMGRKLICSIL